MAYVLIQFTEEDGGALSLVHNTWLTPRKSEVYWPPHKNQMIFNRSLLKGEPVDCNQWKLFGIKRIFGAYDDFGEAQKKVKLAEDTSDLQSDVDDFILRKRQANRPQRYSNSCSSSDEESKLPRPPKINKQIACKGISNSQTCSFENKRSESHHKSDLPTSFVNERKASSPLQERLNTITTQEVWDCSNTRVSLSLPATPTSSIASCSTRRSDTPDSDIHSKLIPYLSTVIEQNKEILAILRTKSTGIQHSVQVPSNLPVKLPLESFEDLELFDGYLLEEKENEQLMSIFLSTLDRTSLVSSTTAVLRYCISYKLAKELSFQGTRQNKKAFKKYNLKNLIVCAVKRAIPSAVERNIEDHIKNWLKRSPRNFQLEQEKRQKQNVANAI